MATRKFLSLKQKIDIIKVQEKENLTVRKLATRFNIGKTQAAEISRNKEAFKALWQSGTNVHQKKNCLTSQDSQVGKLCYDWFVKNKKKGVPISGLTIKAKAKEIAERVKYTEFSASDGWLEKWRKRYKIGIKQFKEEHSSRLRSYKPEDVYGTDESSQFKEVHPSRLRSYKPENICRAGKSSILFDALPKSDKCIGGKLSKERLTLNDTLVIISDSEEELNEETTDSINSYDEALKQIARLKQFAGDDFVSVQHLNKLESHFWSKQSKEKQANYK